MWIDKIVSYFSYKFNFDCYRVLSVLVYALLKTLSIILNVSFCLYILNSDASDEKFHSTTVSPITPFDNTTKLDDNNKISLLEMFFLTSNKTISCEFSNGGVSESIEKLKNDYIPVYVVLLITGLSATLTIVNITSKLILNQRNIQNKIVAIKTSINTNNMFISKFFVHLSKYQNIFENIMFILDDIGILALFSYIFSKSYGSQGIACSKCVSVFVNCFTTHFYKQYTSIVLLFYVIRILFTLLIISYLHVLGFYQWTYTGTMFDFVVLRTIATIIFGIILVIFVITPSLFILQNFYYKTFNITGFLTNAVNVVLPFGLILWAVIVLYKLCSVTLANVT